jgi:hypothetical protein
MPAESRAGVPHFDGARSGVEAAGDKGNELEYGCGSSVGGKPLGQTDVPLARLVVIRGMMDGA